MPVVRVTWFSGKDAAAKQAVAEDITESIVKHTGTDPKYIYVIFEVVGREHVRSAREPHARQHVEVGLAGRTHCCNEVTALLQSLVRGRLQIGLFACFPSSCPHTANQLYAAMFQAERADDTSCTTRLPRSTRSSPSHAGRTAEAI